MSSVLVVDEVIKLKAEYNIKKLKNSAFSFFGASSDNVETLNPTDFFTRFQNLELDKLNFDELILKTENEMKKINFDELRNEFLGENYLFEKFYPIIYKGKYLRDLTNIDENDEVNDCTKEDSFYYFFMKIYNIIYGGRKKVLKNTYFNNAILLLISLFTLYLAYFLLQKMN